MTWSTVSDRRAAAKSEIGSRLGNEGTIAALLAMVLSTVGLLLVALIAAASFVVIAQRRMRHLAMLAAIGATEKQLRVVTVTNGLVVGVVAGVIGVTVGVAAWLGLAPLVEDAVAFRIDQYAVPWWLVVSPMVLAIVAATAAAWWPARSVARVPTVRALSGRPPQPQPARRVAGWSAVSAVGGRGTACSGVATSPVRTTPATWTTRGTDRGRHRCRGAGDAAGVPAGHPRAGG